MGGNERRKPGQRRSSNDDTSGGRSAPADSLSGEAGARPSNEPALPEPPRDLRRSATEMAPGIPAGSGQGIDKALEQPDSDIGGGVAADTTVGLGEGELRDRETVREEDKGRTTL